MKLGKKRLATMISDKGLVMPCLKMEICLRVLIVCWFVHQLVAQYLSATQGGIQLCSPGLCKACGNSPALFSIYCSLIYYILTTVSPSLCSSLCLPIFPSPQYLLLLCFSSEKSRPPRDIISVQDKHLGVIQMTKGDDQDPISSYIVIGP